MISSVSELFVFQMHFALIDRCTSLTSIFRIEGMCGTGKKMTVSNSSKKKLVEQCLLLPGSTMGADDCLSLYAVGFQPRNRLLRSYLFTDISFAEISCYFKILAFPEVSNIDHIYKDLQSI